MSSNVKQEQQHVADEDANRAAKQMKKVKISPSQAKITKSENPASNQKGKKQSKQVTKRQDSDSEEDEDSNEMDDFIAPDDEVHKEMIEEQERKRRKRTQRRQERKDQNSDDEAELKVKSKKRRAEKEKDELDSDDYELLREATGGAAKKGRLRKVGEESFKKEETKMVIDTTDRRKQRMEVPQDDIDMEDLRGRKDLDRHEKAKKIFGEKYVNQERSRIDQSQLEEPFNADEIDDPYTTNQDKKIVQKDVPERLQLRLGDRLDNIVDAELSEEAQWILDKLACLPGEKGAKYSALVGQQDVVRKIFKVLKLFRSENLDVPMITRYRKYEYADELDEDAVWHIYQFDQEFGKFVKQKKKISDVLEKVIKYNPQMELHKSLLGYAKSQSELNNFTYLVRFLQSYYSEELENEEETEERKNQKKQPIKRDDVKIARMNKLDEFASRCLLPWAQYYENLQLRKIAYRPNEPAMQPTNFAEEYLCEAFNDKVKVFEGVVKLAAQELAAQPIIRNMIKKDLRENGYLTTKPTEQGKKDLDVFHASYRVKNINQRLISELNNSDLFLDIAQCEADGLISVEICRNEQQQQNFKNFLEELYMPSTSEGNQWNILRSEVIKTLLERLNSKELEKEVRDELREEAESVVIAKCRTVYKDLLLTGPYTTQDASNEDGVGGDGFANAGRNKKGVQEDIIKDRERLNVLGAFMQQIDMHTFVTTIAIVDKYGELVAHKDFMHLLPPRKRRQNQQEQEGAEEARAPPQQTDEEREHEKDKEKLKELLGAYSVDLIVVAANSLDARNLKKSLDSIAAETKIGQNKEAFVIWGSPEVPKLFAMSHNSQKLHKNTPSILKQAISLCRFEQDPLAEVLNLWSPITPENQALALNLDPLQKFVNQVKLSDTLEEVNIQAINEIGIDLNLVVDHDHMHSMLQFVSGLGPRKSKNLIDRIKQLGSKLITRSQIYKEKLLARSVYISASAFLKIKISAEERNDNQPYDVLDQTRIHHESYKLALQIADDACHTEGASNKDQAEEDRLRQHRRVKEVIQNPERLKNLDIKLYFQQLAASGRSNMKILIDMTIKELTAPFFDPRQYRNPEKVNIPNEKLLYMLIDESERSFRKGMIVTATVSKVFDTKAVCRLENGLAAIILEQDIVEIQDEKINSKLDFGHIITGRIKSIDCEHDKPFEVKLQCKQKDLQTHDDYVEFLTGLNKKDIPQEDIKNANFSVDLKPKQLGRFQARRIAFEKFKNVSSRRAALELHESEVGDFIFRPSTRSENAITLTWKFWRKHLVHIDIQEIEKAQGAAIGSKLMISQETFDNLREIVERYIIPCNRLLREVTNHQKFTDADTFDELSERVLNEKKEDPSKIPYRFGILPAYPQHVVLAYVPKEKVVKEFIRVKPRGFLFHDQTLSPFQALINWFKDNWRNRDYQRVLRRQRSPRLAARVIPPVGTASGAMGQKMEPGNQNDWGNAGGTSSHQQDFNMKQERPNFSRGIKAEGAKSPNNWGGQNQSTGWGDTAGEPQQSGGNSPRGRGRGRGAGGGSRACFKCGEEGHMARECPNPDSNQGGRGGGGGNRACFKCGEEGHMARECPNPDSNQGGGGRGRGGGPITCFKCGEEGHMSRECPNPDAGGGRGRGGGGGNRACFKCGEEGHMARECPQGGGGGDGAYKRQRTDGGGYDNNETSNNAGWADNNAGGGDNNAWGSSGNAPAENNAGWGDQPSNSNDAGAWGASEKPAENSGGGW